MCIFSLQDPVQAQGQMLALSHFPQVLATVTKALDDNRRQVRQAAIACRRVWSPK